MRTSSHRSRSAAKALAFVGVLAVVLAACSRPPAPRVDGKPITSTGQDEPLPPPPGELGVENDAPPPWEPGGDLIRIGLRSGVTELRMESTAALRIEDLNEKKLGEAAGPGLVEIRALRGGIQISAPGLGPSVVERRVLILRGLGRELGFEFKGNEYAGDFMVRKERNGTLTLINIIDLESYLRGVVPWEIGRPGTESLEAVKAQAIAARTYTVSHLGRREALGFDLWDSIEDQVYRGMSGIHAVTDRGVRETRGEVLRDHGELVQAYYSSTCGGHTSDIHEVWNRASIDYLRGVKDAPRDESAWCRESPHFRWTVAWSAHELGKVIREYLPAEVDASLLPREIGVLQGIEVLEYDDSGRVHRLLIRAEGGEWEIRGDRVRWVLRPVRGRFPTLRSALFRLEEFRSEGGELVGVRLQGGGFGHGIGLCQTGALAMARAGRRVDQILEHYYPGTELDELAPSRRDWGAQ